MLANEKQYRPIDVYFVKTEPVSHSLRSHKFNEFIFIKSGKGIHTNNNVSSEFSDGDLFFVPANDKHAFTITSNAEIFVIRFTEEARLTLKEMVEQLNGKAIALVKAKSAVNTKIQFEEKDSLLVLQICMLLAELQVSSARNENLSYLQMLCLVAVIERNIHYGNNNIRPRIVKKKIELILNHIHRNLQDPPALRLKYIAEKFNISINGLSLYFKKETGEPIKKYTDKIKMEQIGELVKTSEIYFSEIAYQYGFTDESHFHKKFLHYFGCSPKVFRNDKN